MFKYSITVVSNRQTLGEYCASLLIFTPSISLIATDVGIFRLVGLDMSNCVTKFTLNPQSLRVIKNANDD